MKPKDLMTIVTVALATASLTVMTFWSGALNAGSDGAQPAAPHSGIVALNCSTAAPVVQTAAAN